MGAATCVTRFPPKWKTNSSSAILIHAAMENDSQNSVLSGSLSRAGWVGGEESWITRRGAFNRRGRRLGKAVAQIEETQPSSHQARGNSAPETFFDHTRIHRIYRIQTTVHCLPATMAVATGSAPTVALRHPKDTPYQLDLDQVSIVTQSG